MANKVLIVVDMQRDFIDGALGTAQAQAIVPAAAEYIRACREKGYQILATLDTHGPDYLNTAEGRKLPVPHCIKDTDGWRLHPAIAEAAGDALLVEKGTFGSLQLADMVFTLCRGQQPDIELLGVCTDICVVSNALMLKAHFPEAPIAVKKDLCAGVTPEKQLAALETMASCQIDLM